MIYLILCLFLNFAHAHTEEAFQDLFTTEASLYPKSYEDSRQRFLHAFDGYNSIKPVMESFKVPSRFDPDLTTDLIYIQAPQQTKKLVILMTGVHGGEAFAANAVMMDFIKNLMPKITDKNVGYIFVHALNPYGFKYFQRTTENNIDLNRNFPVNPNIYQTKNLQYQEIRDLLVEEKPLNIFSLHNLFLLPRLGWLLITKPQGFVLQATAGGQYQDPQGVFYGGNRSEPQIEMLTQALRKYAKKYSDIFYVDLHTGYGKKGHLHLFGTPNLSENHKNFTEKVFIGQAIDYGGNKGFYKTSGDSVTYMSKLFVDKNVAGMCFEFGTLDSQKTIGSFLSLQTLRFESQGKIYGYDQESDKVRARKMSIKMFDPQELQWREQVLKQGKEQLANSIENFIRL